MMQEYISLTDHLENILLILKFRYRCRLISRCLVSVKAIRTIYFHKHGKIQRSVYLKNICLFDVKFRFQDLQQAFIYLILYFQTDNLTPLTFL